MSLFFRRASILSASLFALGCVNGCGGGGVTDFLGTTVNVSMVAGPAFSPVDIVCPAGGRVIWLNTDGNAHSVTSDTNEPNLTSDVQFPAGLHQGNRFGWFVPLTAVSGTKFYYHCRFHGTAGNGSSLGTGMAGSVTVQ